MSRDDAVIRVHRDFDKMLRKICHDEYMSNNKIITKKQATKRLADLLSKKNRKIDIDFKFNI